MTNLFCKKCGYVTDILCNWEKHILTQKHIRDEKKIVCEFCGKTYKTTYTLNRHVNTVCNKLVEPEEADDNKITAEMISQLIKQNDDLKQMLEDRIATQTKEITDKIDKQQQQLQQVVSAKPTRRKRLNTEPNNGTVNNSIIHNNINNGTINAKNKFNINVFLNVKCKDALNLSDFIESIKVEVEDVERLGELGFAAGISHIIIGALENLDLYKRPIHCKKKTMYVKEEDKWSEDEKRQQVMRLVRNVSQKNLRVLCSTLMGPERMDTESPDYDKQVALIRQVNGGRHRDSSEHDIVKQIDEFVQLYEQALMDADFTREELNEMERRICGEESLV